MEKDSGKIFHELRDDLSAYAKLKLELLKLNTYERTGRVTAVLSYGLIVVFLILFAILFIFMAIGYFLGDTLDNTGLGFAIVFLMYVIIIACVAGNRRRITTRVQNEIIEALMTNDDKNDKQTADTPGKTPSGETTSENGVRDAGTRVE